MAHTRMPDLGTPLTASELRILAWTVNGMSAPEIARDYHYSVHTVSSHLARIYAKLGARNAAHATYIACRQGLLASQLAAVVPPLAWIFVNNRRESSDVLYVAEDRAKQAAIAGFLDDGISSAPFEWQPVLGGLTREQQLFHDGRPTGWRVAVQLWADAPHLERAS